MQHLTADFWNAVGLALSTVALIYAIRADGQLAEILTAIRRQRLV